MSSDTTNFFAEPPEEPRRRRPVVVPIRSDGQDGRPLITCVAGELPRMVREAEDALIASGLPIYQRAVLVRPAEQEFPAADGGVTHSAVLIPLAPAALTVMLSRAANWQKWDARAKANVICDPPTKLVDALLASRGEWRLPIIRGVLTCPTLRSDGSLLTRPGYDPASRYYLMFPSGLSIPPIPTDPTPGDAVDALERLDRLLDGYDFVEDGGISRSVALAILMTQVLRCGMSVSPLLAVSATAPGSGKSHLIDLAAAIAVGRPCPIMGAGKSDEETEKGINTNLLSGVPGFSIDNVHRMVDLAVLNIATERPMVGIRTFGTLEKTEVENAVTIYMTGNNLPVVGEQVRRTLLCSMDTGEEQPEQREFADTDPIRTVLADRGRYIADILIIARAYIVSGAQRPPDIRPLGSYTGWSRLVREPLIWLGRPDPVASQDTTRSIDPEMTTLRAITSAWRFAFGSEAHPVSHAIKIATTPPQSPNTGFSYGETDMPAYLIEKEKHERLRDALLETFPGKANSVDAKRLGEYLRKYNNRIAGGLWFARESTNLAGSAQWRVLKRGD